MITYTRPLLCGLVAAVFALQAYAAGGGSESAWNKETNSWNVEIYPVYAWVPVLGASVTLPTFPNLPNLPDLPGGTRPSGNASSGLSGAVFTALRVEKSRWVVEFAGLYAGLSAESTSPKAKIGLDVLYGQGTLGREVLPGLTLEAGARRIALKISATLLDYPEVSRKPGVWDPVVGASYRRTMGRKWRLSLHADTGGFGVGSDNSAVATVKFDYRISKHFGTTLGYGMLHFKNTNTVASRTLTIDQTMHGPILAAGFFF